MKKIFGLKKWVPPSTKVNLGLTLSVISLCIALSHAGTNRRILNFYGVGGFYHNSILTANNLLDSLCRSLHYQLDTTTQAKVFTKTNLAQYDAVIINNSTILGKLLTNDQKLALLNFIKTKGYLGFHGAGDTKGSFSEYTTLLGGELSSVGGGNASLLIDSISNYARNSSILIDLPRNYVLGGEWYAYKTNPRLAPNVKVLYTLDEASCPYCVKMGPEKSNDHPVVWVNEDPTGGRMFYMAMGHDIAVFQKDIFTKKLITQALRWAARDEIVSTIHQTAFDNNNNVQIKSQQSSLTVDIHESGPFTLELLTLNGKRVAFRKGENNNSYTFANLHANTVYSVMTHSKSGKHAQLIMVQ